MLDPQSRPGAVDAQQVAEAVRDAMRAGRPGAGPAGHEVLAVGPGTATVALTVREDMLNGHDICHGGLMTTLADTAFAYACNAYNEVTVATGFDVNIVASGKLGDR
jgi:acyl-CoA thioesterase